MKNVVLAFLFKKILDFDFECNIVVLPLIGFQGTRGDLLTKIRTVM